MYGWLERVALVAVVSQPHVKQNQDEIKVQSFFTKHNSSIIQSFLIRVVNRHKLEVLSHNTRRLFVGATSVKYNTAQIFTQAASINVFALQPA